MFWAAADIGAVAAVVDLEASVMEWAAEAMLNDGDGYYGGGHHFYIYDYPGKGYRWMHRRRRRDVRMVGAKRSQPIYWWAGRTSMQDAGRRYLIVIADPTWRATLHRGAADPARALGRRAPAGMDRRVVGADRRYGGAGSAPAARHGGFQRTVAEMRQEIVDRPAYVTKFLACQDGTGDASDKDGDGFAWCNDCDDANIAVNPGAVEICGNGIDDNCNPSSTPTRPAACPAM